MSLNVGLLMPFLIVKKYIPLVKYEKSCCPILFPDQIICPNIFVKVEFSEPVAPEIFILLLNGLGGMCH
jgi:hypothetical protein